MATTNAGAATNNTMSAWIRSVSLSGVPAMVIMVRRDAFSAPNNRPASTTPSGRERPSSATVMASKPSVPMMVPVICVGVPVSSCGAVTIITPPRPANAPASAMVMIVMFDTLAPDTAAAFGFRPTAFSCTPNFVRSRSHHTMKAASRAMTNPRWRRVPASRGIVAVHSNTGEMGSLRPGAWNAFCIIRYASRLPAM